MKKYQLQLERSDKWIVSSAVLLAILLFSALTYDILFFKENQKGQIEVGEITSIKNNVKRKFSSSLIWYQAQQSETVYENDWIFTGSSSIAKIKLKTGGEIIVEPDSMIVLSNKNGVLELNLQHGRLMADVKQKEVKINVVRDNAVDTINTNDGIVAVSVDKDQTTKVEPVQLFAEEKDSKIDPLADPTENGEPEPAVAVTEKTDLSLSEVAEIKFYEPDKGFSRLDKNFLSYESYKSKTVSQLKGTTAEMNVHWKDPLKKWQEYDIEVAKDPSFQEVLKTETHQNQTLTLQATDVGSLYWRVRGKNGEEQSHWSSPNQAEFKGEWYNKGPQLALQKKNLKYQIRRKELSRVKPDRTLELTKDTESLPMEIEWDPDQRATNYRVQLSDRSDFSNIIEEKIVKDPNVELTNLKLGHTYFKVVPEDSNGQAIAEEASGEIKTFLPAPQDESLKTEPQEETVKLSWEDVPYAQGYEVSYIKDRETKKVLKKITNKNELEVPKDTNFLQWKVRVIEPDTKKSLSTYTQPVDWYDQAKQLASVHGTGQSVTNIPVIVEPAPRRTYIAMKKAPLFIAMAWTYEEEAIGYEIEVSNKPDMSRLIYKKRVKDRKKVFINKTLPAGIYYMRVRALHEDVTQESWSKTEVFRVLNKK